MGQAVSERQRGGRRLPRNLTAEGNLKPHEAPFVRGFDDFECTYEC